MAFTQVFAQLLLAWMSLLLAVLPNLPQSCIRLGEGLIKLAVASWISLRSRG